MMKVDKHFPILRGGEEVTAEILSAFVYKEDIYLAVGVSGEVLLYQVLPNGLKDAPRPVLNQYLNEVLPRTIPQAKRKGRKKRG